MKDAQRPGWPFSTGVVRAQGGRGPLVRLRSLTKKDGGAWRQLRIEDENTLRPVEPTVEASWEAAHSRGQWRRTWGMLQASARRGMVIPGVIEVEGSFAGQLTLGNIQHGIVSSCWIGYWVHSQLWGRGVATAAVALGVDHAFRTVGLHRVEATVMQDNGPSRAVLAKAGFRQEGYLIRNLHINGRWQDHMLMAVTKEEVFTQKHRGVVARMVDEGLLRAL